MNQDTNGSISIFVQNPIWINWSTQIKKSILTQTGCNNLNNFICDPSTSILIVIHVCNIFLTKPIWKEIPEPDFKKIIHLAKQIGIRHTAWEPNLLIEDVPEWYRKLEMNPKILRDHVYSVIRTSKLHFSLSDIAHQISSLTYTTQQLIDAVEGLVKTKYKHIEIDSDGKYFYFKSLLTNRHLSEIKE